LVFIQEKYPPKIRRKIRRKVDYNIGPTQVRYRIVNGDRGGNFTIDAITGEIRPRGIVDFELMAADNGSDSRRFRSQL
jgi:hypothetical protein